MASFAKRKKTLAVCPNHDIMRREKIEVETITLWRERRVPEQEVERVSSTLKSGGFHGGEGAKLRKFPKGK